MHKVLYLIAALAAGIPGAAFALTDYPFRVETVRHGGLEQVVARNDGPAPITTHVTLAGENVNDAASWPLTVVVPPYAVLPLGHVGPQDAAQSYRYLFSYTYYVGRVDASHASSTLYRFPFQNGKAYAITQAQGGRLTSHNNRQNFYAVDFAMPIGTPILAAREGVVVDVVLKYEQGGNDVSLMEKANMITIAHEDGTIAEYAHLSPGSPVVRRGQRVAAGTLIGHSGNTGYSTGPHLHFVVSRPEIENGKVIRLSLPVQFYSGESGLALTPRAGTVAVADYPEHPVDRIPATIAAGAGIEEAPLASQPLTAQGSTDR